MLKKSKQIHQEKKNLAYQIFQEEFANKKEYLDLPLLAEKTGIHYLKIYRAMRGEFDLKADDFIRICIVMGRRDLISKLIDRISEDLR